MSDADTVAGGNRLPKFFDVAADPCDQNPFPADDPRHGAWLRATRRAEEVLSELAELMPEAYACRLENEWTRTKAELRDGGPVSPISMSPLLVPFYRGTFDAWAWRNLAAIAGDSDLPIYDGWLVKYAQSWLDLIESRDLPNGLKLPLVHDLHAALQTGIAHWKSEARKYLRPQQEQVKASDLDAPSPRKDKGNLEILRGVDGNLKNAVTLDVAIRFGGVSRRAIEKAVKKGTLQAAGDRLNRRILVHSLLKYFPPENNAN